MARVYYRENKLSGKPFTGNSITIEVFNEILTKANPPRNHFEQVELTYGENTTFKTAILWKGDFYYKHNGQNIYLPDAIILGDDFTLPYPDEYYFIARIGGSSM